VIARAHSHIARLLACLLRRQTAPFRWRRTVPLPSFPNSERASWCVRSFLRSFVCFVVQIVPAAELAQCRREGLPCRSAERRPAWAGGSSSFRRRLSRAWPPRARANRRRKEAEGELVGVVVGGFPALRRRDCVRARARRATPLAAVLTLDSTHCREEEEEGIAVGPGGTVLRLLGFITQRKELLDVDVDSTLWLHYGREERTRFQLQLLSLSPLCARSP